MRFVIRDPKKGRTGSLGSYHGRPAVLWLS